MPAQRDPHDAPAIRAFGVTLRKMRDAAGLTRKHFAETLGYSPQFIGQIEAAKNVPSRAFAQDLDTHFALDGLFLALWRLTEETRRLGTPPADFAAYARLERGAATIRAFATRVIPDLLRTEEYARAVAGPETVRTSAERKAVLDRPDPPHVFAIIDEDALRRKVAPPDVVRAQFAHLLALTERPQVGIQVLAHDAECRAAYSGSFTVLGFDGDRALVHIESAGQGSLIGAPSAVASCVMRFDVLRGHACSVKESRAILAAYSPPSRSPSSRR